MKAKLQKLKVYLLGAPVGWVTKEKGGYVVNAGILYKGVIYNHESRIVKEMYEEDKALNYDISEIW